MSFFHILLCSGLMEDILTYTPSVGDVLLDIPRSYGYNGVPVVGAIVISDENITDVVMAKVLHNDGVIPTITAPVGITLSKTAGDYLIGVDNEIYFIAHKNNSGVVDMITYTICPNLI